MTAELFVNGTLMRGLALHGNLDGAEFLGEAQTAPCYRLYSIDDVHPGMFQVQSGGVSVAGEIYRLPDELWQRVEAAEPANLYKGPVTLSDGRVVDGILYPRTLAESAHRDISEFGGWRAYMAQKPTRQVQTAHVDDVEKVKTGFGFTKFLVRNKPGEGANIMIRYWGPETNVPVHSHPYDEMWYVLEGEVIFGDTVYTAGSCVYIPRNVPYGPATAPKGVALLRYAEGAGEV